MNCFTYNSYSNQPILDAYKQWLVSDLYHNYDFDSTNDPNFLHKLSFIQAEGVRHDIKCATKIVNSSIENTNSQIGNRIYNAAQLISSSLDNGFTLMNNRFFEVNCNLNNIDKGIGIINQNLQNGNEMLKDMAFGINQANSGIGKMNANINSLHQTISSGLLALNSNISQSASVIKYQLQQEELLLKEILKEIKIPESQRERRYHIEEGIKFYNKGMQSGDKLYFEDALEEFSSAIAIDKKDYFSWYYKGMIYLYSDVHLNLNNAIAAFNHYIHYADALQHRHSLFDDALMMKAECKYLMNDVDGAFEEVRPIINNNYKAALRGMKYLSASKNEKNQEQSVEILKGLIQKNPYIIMQILEDFDLISNKYIIKYLEQLKKTIILNIGKLWKESKEVLNSLA